MLDTEVPIARLIGPNPEDTVAQLSIMLLCRRPIAP